MSKGFCFKKSSILVQLTNMFKMRPLLFFGLMLFFSCNTTDELPEDYLGEVIYNVQATVNNITITYLDEDGTFKEVEVSDGNWIHSFGAPLNTEVSLQVTSPQHYADITMEITFAGKTMERQSCSMQDEPADCSVAGVTKQK